MTKSQLFTRAHAIARTLQGDYKARFSYSLSVAWKEFKGEKKMIELKGTEKQVKWANDIRERLLKDLEIAEKSLETYKWNKEKAIAKLEESKEKFASIDSAKYYIDNHKDYKIKNGFGTREIKENLGLSMRLIHHAFVELV